MASSIRGKSVEKQGYLWMKQPNRLKGKTWQWKYVVLTNCSQENSSACLELYESNVAFLACAAPTSFITLDVINYVGEIESQKKAFSFFLLVGKKQEQLATEDEAGRIEWIQAIKQLRYKQPATSYDCRRRSAPCQPCQQEVLLNNPGRVSTTTDARACFLVRFKGTTSESQLLKIETSYLLHVGAKCVTVLNSSGSKDHVLSWPLSTIRSYESVSTNSSSLKKLFTIETGRQSITGSGTFNFLTSFANQIANQIRLKTNKSYLKKNQKTASVRLPPARSFSSPSVGLRARTLSNSFPVYESLSETSRDAFGDYVTEGDGLYISVLTRQEDVEERRRDKARSASQSNAEHEPDSPDDERANYIEVLLEDEPDVDCLAYIELIDDSEPSDQTGGNRSRALSDEASERSRGPSVLEDDGEAGITEESGASGECNEQHCETREETRGDLRYESREASHVSRHDSRHDARGTYEVRTTIESASSVDSELCPHSLTSQASSFDYRSASSEDDVFGSFRNKSITSDAFSELEEPTTSADDIPEQIFGNNDNLTKNFGETRSIRETEGLEKNGRFRGSHDSDLSLPLGDKDQILNDCDGEEITNCRDECENSGDTCVNSGNACVDSGDTCANSGNTCANSGNTCANSGNACSNSANVRVNSENASSSSENACSNPGNTCVNTGDACDEESSETSNWPSETEKDADDTPEPHEGSTNENTTSTSPEKATTNCKESKRVIIKRNSSKSSTKPQKFKSPKKAKSGKIFHRFINKFINSTSVENVEEMVQPCTRSFPVHDSLFVRNLKEGKSSVHAQVLESDRVKLGLAPSPAQSAHALSFGGKTQASTNSSPTKNENMLPVTKRLLTAARSSEQSLSRSRPKDESYSPGYNALSKALTYTPARDVGKEPRKLASSCT